jgi:hypothetical protein
MSAPDLVTLYDIESGVETPLQTILENNLTVGGVTVAKQRDINNLLTPRAEVQLSLGAMINRFNYTGTAGPGIYEHAWNAELAVAIFTERARSEPGAHAQLRAQLRLFMQYGYLILGANALPYHTLVQIRSARTQIGIDEKESEDISRLHFSCIVGIRTDAWPA